MVCQCSTCRMQLPAPPKAPLHLWEYPQQRWSSIHAGLFIGHLFSIIVDAYSKWTEAIIVPFTSAEASIKVLCSVYATYGIHEHI